MKTSRFWRAAFCAMAIACGSLPASAGTRDATAAADVLALGVYWPYGRTSINAQAAGLDIWDYTDWLMQCLHDHSVNLIWVTGIPTADMAPFCDQAEAHALRVVASPNYGVALQDAAPAAIDRRVADIVAQWSACDALVGYVGLDEPKGKEMDVMNLVAQAFRRHDPSRFFTLVLRPHETPLGMASLEADVVGLDPYSFFADGVPWFLSQPPGRSPQNHYIRDVEMGVRMAGVRNKACWSFPQLFSEVYGGSMETQRAVYYDPDIGKNVAVVGSLVNWRMPTVAETTWQAWTSLRLGSRGLVAFVLLPGTAYEDKATYLAKHGEARLATPHPQSNVTTPMALDPFTAMVDANRATAPQFDALGSVFGELTPWLGELGGARPDHPLAWCDLPLSVSTLSNARSGRRYLVIVNDDLEQTTSGFISVLPCVANVSAIAGGQVATLSSHGSGDTGFTLTLGPGEGSLVEVLCPPLSCARLMQIGYGTMHAGDMPLQVVENAIPLVFREGADLSCLAVEDPTRAAWVQYTLPDFARNLPGGRLFLSVDLRRTKWRDPVDPGVSFSGDGVTFTSAERWSGVIPLPSGTKAFRVDLSPEDRLEKIQIVYSEAGLLAYEGFVYPVGESLAGKAGGVGFAGPWADGLWKAGTSLAYPVGVDLSLAGGAGLENDGLADAPTKRALSAPLNLDSEGTYYFSAIMNKRDGHPTGGDVLTLYLNDSSSTKARFGISSDEKTHLGMGGGYVAGTVVMPAATDILVVAKLVTHAPGTPDTLSLKRHLPHETPPWTEPDSWDQVAASEIGGTINSISLACGVGIGMIDEIRIGMDWFSVVGVAPPPTAIPTNPIAPSRSSQDPVLEIR